MSETLKPMFEEEELKEDRVTLDVLTKNETVPIYLDMADKYIGAIGFTEHGPRHAALVAHIAHNVLDRLRYPKREAELAAIAGYLHDIGNTISRQEHGLSGALLARSILKDMGMAEIEIALVMNAIGNHEEEYGWATHHITAALVLADKADVHRSRVRQQARSMSHQKNDIHDRVNYAAQKSFLRVDDAAKKISLEIQIDTTISKVMDYFEIFLTRMVMCRQAAEVLGCSFSLVINDVQLL
ncbi:MAG: HD domain-containing protein [Actinomycetota bacterium]|nr:HD domain-containing protein [Actinomycetota bacterium]